MLGKNKLNTKKYETAEELEKCFKYYVHYSYDYYYIVLKKLRENKQAQSEFELNLEERTILNKKYLSYLYIWEEIEYFLTKKLIIILINLNFYKENF